MQKFTLHRSGLVAGLTDQAVVSLGNFGLGVLLARSFIEHEFGTLSIILSFALFLNTLHQAFVTFPLSVRGAPAEHSRFRYLLTVAATFTLMGALLFFPIMSGATLTVADVDLLPLTCLFLLSWQLQEVHRRGLLARARYGAAIASDFVRYIVPVAVIPILNRLVPASPQSVFLILSLCALFACGALIPALTAHLPAVWRNTREELRGNWRLASPILFANILAVFSNQWFFWLLAWGHDLAGAAALVALTNVVAFCNPVMYGMENTLVPEIARRRADLTFENMLVLVARRSLACSALVAPLFLVIFIWPGLVLELLYGDQRVYVQFTFALRIVAVAYLTYLVANTLSATLRGYSATNAVFKMQFYPALLGVTLGSWLTLRFGVTGACSAAFLAGVLRASLGCYYVNQLRKLTAR